MAAGKKLPPSACDWSAWSPKYGGNPVDTIRARLGIKGTKIPASMHGEWNIDGWKVVIKRSPSGGGTRRTKSSKHRIYIRHNGDLVPAGRVRQTLCRIDVHKARRRAARHRGAKGRFEYKRR